MIKKTAIILAIIMMGLLLWVFLGPVAPVSIFINGQEVTGPAGWAVSIWATILTTVILFCVAILLAFVFTGVGLVLLFVFSSVLLILASVLLPFLLPLMLPLFIVWMFCALLRKRKTKSPNPDN